MAERVYKALAITEQGLTEEEKLTARTNIGAIGGVKVMDSTGTTELVPDAEGKVTVDLTNAGGTNADWAETNPSEKSFILNKPDLSVFATKTELTEGLAGKQNTLIAGENIVIDGDTISAVVPPGAFIGVYTGNTETNTPYADYLSAWQEGKPVFVKYTLAGGDIFMQMDQIDEDKAIFTRTVGYVADGVYGHVSNVLLRVGSSDNSYTFYTTSLDPTVQQQSNWTEADPNSPSFILNKPNLSAVATSGSYNDLTDKPTIPVLPTVKPLVAGSGIDITEEANAVRITNTGNNQVQSDWTQTNSSDPSYIKHKPNLSAVATSGSYNDLTDKPDIPSQQEQADWTEQDSSAPSYIKHKPAIPSAQIQSDWAQTNSSSVDFIKNKPTLSAVATSGNYSDLNGKPTIPPAQIQSDWNQSDSSQVDFIKNKPAQMETKPLVAGTNMEFVSASDSVTINSTATKVSTRSAPYTTAVPLTAMDINDPGADFGSIVKDGGGNTIGFLAPKHYGQVDEGKVLTVVNDNGYKMEWRPQVGSSSDLKVLTENQQTVNSGTGAYQLTIVDGTCYTLTLAADREVQLVTNSTETLHTRIAIHNYDANTCGGCYLTWRDEGLVQHSIYLMLYNQPDTVEYFFDVYIKKVVVNGTTYAIARVHDYPCAYRDGYTDGYATDNTNFIGRDY